MVVDRPGSWNLVACHRFGFETWDQAYLYFSGSAPRLGLIVEALGATGLVAMGRRTKAGIRSRLTTSKAVVIEVHFLPCASKEKGENVRTK
jgi:hypothetical protein